MAVGKGKIVGGFLLALQAALGKYFYMTVSIHPQPGTIVIVDLNQGFRKPEMVKKRPAIIISALIPKRPTLCTIVPLSTTPPNPPMDHHCELHLDPPLPHPYVSPTMWVKADMVLTVAFHRLRLPFAGWDQGQRAYDIRVISEDELQRVKDCVRSALGL